MSRKFRFAFSVFLLTQAELASAQLNPTPPGSPIATLPTPAPWEPFTVQCAARGPSTAPLLAESITSEAQGEAAKFGNLKGAEGTWAILNGADFDRVENSFAWGRVYYYWKTAGALGTWNIFAPKIDQSGKPLLNGTKVQYDTNFDIGRAFDNLDKARRLAGSPLSKWEAFTIQANLVLPKVVQDDYAWSAVFVSTVMARVGLTKEQFRRATLHTTYLSYALEATKGNAEKSAYIACPPDDRTIIRVGDLICNSRDQGRVHSFFDIWNRTLNKSHCDIVTSVETLPSGSALRTIGGNVEDTVMIRHFVSTAIVPTLASIPAKKCYKSAEPCEWVAVMKLRENL